jgi:plastocyanin
MSARLLLAVGLSALFMVACDEPGTDEDPEAGPRVTLPADGADEDCAEVSAPEGAPVGVTMMDSFFEPDCVAVSSEQGATLTNAGNLDHNFTIQGTELSYDVEPGEDEETDEFGDAVAAGTYRFFCRFHEAQGMVGTIVVE